MGERVDRMRRTVVVVRNVAITGWSSRAIVPTRAARSLVALFPYRVSRPSSSNGYVVDDSPHVGWFDFSSLLDPHAWGEHDLAARQRDPVVVKGWPGRRHRRNQMLLIAAYPSETLSALAALENIGEVDLLPRRTWPRDARAVRDAVSLTAAAVLRVGFHE